MRNRKSMKNVLPTILDCIEEWSSCLYTAIQIGGFAILFLGIFLIVSCTIVISRIVLPILTTPGSPLFIFLWLLCSSFSFAILFNYTAVAIFRSPKVSAEETCRLAIAGELLSLQQQRALLDAPARYCEICNRFKAPREHHCSICKRCVTKMDHHCPWINNCVDAENHRYFILFLIYLLISTGTVVSILTIAYIRLSLHGKTNNGPYGPHWNKLQSFPVFFTYIICILMFVCMFFFVGCNTLHILRNETQIESYIVKRKEKLSRNSMIPFRNPYDLGRWRNILNLFATRGDPFIESFNKCGVLESILLLFWLILPTLRSSSCDGVHYLTFDDVMMMPV